jgi:hypothetical protein
MTAKPTLNLYEVLLSRTHAMRLRIEAESPEAAEERVDAGDWDDTHEIDSDCLDVTVCGVTPYLAPPWQGSGDDVTNRKRAAWADACVTLFTHQTGCDREDVLGDLLCDLMHWAVQNKFAFDLAFDRARDHFEVEVAEEGEAAQ